MQVLLDECVPVRLRTHVQDHDVRTVQFMKWNGIKNAELLRLLVETGFEVFVTVDTNLSFQLDVRHSGIGVIQMEAKSNRIQDLLPLVPQLRSALGRIRPGEFIRISL